MSGNQEPRLEMAAVHFSTRCGANCAFCYFGNPLSAREEPTSLDMVSRVLHRLAQEGVRDILFVGGDPVLHPHFAESVALAKHLGLTTVVLSNSWALRPLKDFENQLHFIDFCEATVLGHTPELHDAIAGQPGAYLKLIHNLKLVCATGKRVGVCLNVMPQNLAHIYDIVRALANEHALSLRGSYVSANHSKRRCPERI